MLLEAGAESTGNEFSVLAQVVWGSSVLQNDRKHSLVLLFPKYHCISKAALEGLGDSVKQCTLFGNPGGPWSSSIQHHLQVADAPRGLAGSLMWGWAGTQLAQLETEAYELLNTPWMAWRELKEKGEKKRKKIGASRQADLDKGRRRRSVQRWSLLPFGDSPCFSW